MTAEAEKPKKAEQKKNKPRKNSNKKIRIIASKKGNRKKS